MSRTRYQRCRVRRILLAIVATIVATALWIAVILSALAAEDCHHYTPPEPCVTGYLPEDFNRSAYEIAVIRYDAEHSPSIYNGTKGGGK